MNAIISWWDLSRSSQTIDTLRVYLQEGSIASWGQVQGLRLKFWISDRKTNRWGAVMLLESTTAPMPPNRASELIGYPPTERMCADIEAIIEGVNTEEQDDHGRAFASIDESS